MGPMGRRPPATSYTVILLAALALTFVVLAPQPLSAQTTPSSAFIPNPVAFEFPLFSFKGSSLDSFKLLGDSSTNKDALQITPDTSNDPQIFLVNKSGRVVLNRPFKLWHVEKDGSVRLASFAVSFDINVFYNWTAGNGEGLAFAILPDLSEPPPNSTGGFLGLTNATTDGDPRNRFVAVELDTVKQAYDPDNNHIALNINSVKSNPNATVPLNSSGIGIVLTERGQVSFYTIWVDYNGTTKELDVYMGKKGTLPTNTVTKPTKPLIHYPIDLKQYVAQNSYFGFSASTGPNNYELHCVIRWSIAIESLPTEGGGSGLGLKVGLPAGLAALALVLVLVSCLYLRWRRDEAGEGRLGVRLKSMPGMPREFKYDDLRKATDNFDQGNKLGRGGYGTVYRGRLAGSIADTAVSAHADEESAGSHRTATEVAVKMFSKASKQNDFYQELEMINRLRHRNLVRLEGWCYKRGKLLLVYEYMPNGSLDKHLFDSPNAVLPWDRRYKILADVGSALHYLHTEYDQTVIHRDIKASNIMLDTNFQARLGDFGLARAVDAARGSYTEAELSGMPGTRGYLAPECCHTLRATPESDVFAFGAVVLEVVCGMRPLDQQRGESSRMLSDWVWKLHREGKLHDAVDTKLCQLFDEEEAERLLLLGLACSHPVAGERPKAQEIVQIMYKTRDPPTVPENKPHFIWPPMPDVHVSTSTTSTTSAFVSSVSSTGAVVSAGGGCRDINPASGSAVSPANHVSESPSEYNSDHYLTSTTDLSVKHGR